MSNFRLPHTSTSRAPASRMRNASSCDCASTSVNCAAAGRISESRRRPLRALRLAQACVGEHHRHAVAHRLIDQVGPHLGFHQHTDGGLVAPQEAAHRAGRVVRQPALMVAFAPPGAAGIAPGGGAVGEQQSHAGTQLAQRLDQRAGGARLAERHRVHPHGTRLGGRPEAQALAPGSPVPRLAASAPPQAHEHQRQRQAQHQRPQRARDHRGPSARRSVNARRSRTARRA